VRLDDETLPAPPTISTRFDPPVRHSHLPGHVWPPYAVELFVTGDDAPIILLSSEIVVLGRSKSTEAEQHLDLSKYGASALGVSRRHATIRFSDEDCLLEDLGSSNGTWLNGNRLTAYKPHPLQNGDVVRLGQLILFVYFQEMPEVA
jgi:pSer/pThr/pTyr-binding forkhead associated (FHA) protein